jgi:very-short-patch-repair endonuclease
MRQKAFVLAAHAHRLRCDATESEQILWRALSRSQLCGVRFRRQVVLLESCIVDFYAPGARVAVEVDGAYHERRRDADARRDRKLARPGYRVLRLPTPLGGGLRVPWLPLFLPLSWPFCWWIFVVVDHFSRAVVHVAVFPGQPSPAEICLALDEAVRRATGPPKYLITDQASQFRDEYRAWCKERDIQPRFGGIGQHGSIAVVERSIRTLKSEGLRRFLLPLRREVMQAESSSSSAGTTQHGHTLVLLVQLRLRCATASSQRPCSRDSRRAIE